MNNKKSNSTTKIVLSVGDESGIGPEIILKVLLFFLIFIKSL